MKTTILTTGVLVAAISLLVFELQRTRRDSESSHALSDTLDRQVATLHAASKLPVASKLPIAPSTAPTTTTATPKPLPPGVFASYSDTNVLGDPEYAATIARRQRLYAMANLRGTINAMHFSPADITQLKELVAAKWLAEEDTSDALDRMGNTTPELRQKAHAAIRAEAEQKIKDLLGPEGYADYQNAQRESAIKHQSWQLFTDFWDSGMPLSSEQQTSLARAMVALRAEFPSGTEAPLDPQTGLRPEVLQLLATASSFLTPEQLNLLRDRKSEHARYDQIVLEKNRREQAASDKSH
jgi:hypothetical protein